MQGRLVLRRPAEAVGPAPAAVAAPTTAPTAQPRLVLAAPPKVSGVPVRGHLRRVDGGVVTVRPHGREPTPHRMPPAFTAKVGESEPAGVQLPLAPRADGGEPRRIGNVQLSLAMLSAPVPMLNEADARAALALVRAQMLEPIARGEMPGAALLTTYDAALGALLRVVSDDAARYDEALKDAAAMEDALRACRPRG